MDCDQITGFFVRFPAIEHEEEIRYCLKGSGEDRLIMLRRQGPGHQFHWCAVSPRPVYSQPEMGRMIERNVGDRHLCDLINWFEDYRYGIR